MSRLTGEALRTWAHEQIRDYARGDQSLELLLVEAYLRGAVDALKEEVTFLTERGPGGRQENTARQD